ncbi:hypothetical protein EON76_03000 [bacterium]|nr:MAG: hypothetical protein EON76_03000 [bacterium]
MNEHVETTKVYIKKYKTELIIGVSIILVAVVVIAAVVQVVYNSTPKVVYQPAKACELLTMSEAKSLMGEKTLNSNIQNPVQSGNIATSNCGYTDGNPQTDDMIVAAISVRSGINDDGVRQNVTEFSKAKPTRGVEAVKDIGDDAYFNTQSGQLNVRDGKNWIIFSYGMGSSPTTNTLDQTLQLARKVIPQKSV